MLVKDRNFEIGEIWEMNYSSGFMAEIIGFHGNCIVLLVPKKTSCCYPIDDKYYDQNLIANVPLCKRLQHWVGSFDERFFIKLYNMRW